MSKHETNETQLSDGDLSQVQGGLSIYIPPGGKPFVPDIKWPLPQPLPLPPRLREKIRELIEKAKQKQPL